MSRYKARPVLLTVLLTVFLTPMTALAVVGGEPGDLVYKQAAENSLTERTEVVITSTGVMFTAINRYSDLGQSEIVILRSEDHGRSWGEWGVLNDPGGQRVWQHGMGLMTYVSSEDLVVSYLKSGSPNEIWVCNASSASPAPIWDKQLVESVAVGAGGYPQLAKPRLAIHDDPSGFDQVGVAYWVALAENDYELRYTVSRFASYPLFPWYYKVVVVDPPAPAEGTLIVDAELGFGADRTVHLVSMRRLTTAAFEYTKIQHLSASWGGIDPSFWDSTATIILDEESSDYTDLTLACDPDGDEVVVGYSQILATGQEVQLQISLDDGATWGPGTWNESALYEDFELTWTSQGPMATAFRDSTYYILRADSSTLGTYESVPYLRCNSSIHFPGQVVLDPTHSDQIAMIAAMEYEPGQGTKLWFNAEWRDEPGYAVAQPVWSQELADPNQRYVGAPGVADLDGDGLMEIVIASDSDTLWAYNGDGSAGQFYDLGVAGTASIPVLIDLNNDGDLEVVVGGPAGQLHILDNNLQPLTTAPVGFDNSVDVYVSAGPVTGFIAAEIVAVSGNKVHLLNIQGTERAGWPQTIPGATAVGRAAIGDVNGNTETEVVVAFDSGVIVLGPDGTALNFLLASAVAPAAAVTLVDIDGDGDLELAVPMSDGTVELIHHDGTSVGPAWPYDTGTNSPVRGVTVARVLDNSEETLCFVTESGSLFAVGIDGVELAGYPVTVDTGDAPRSEPIVARVARPNSDRPQLLISTEEGWLHEWRAQGETPADWPNFYDLGPALSPVVADVDADGIAEIVLAVGHKIYVFDTGTAPLVSERRRWPMAGHDLARSGCADCLPQTPSAVPESSPGSGTRIAFAGAYPNPMPGRTAFSFALPTAGEVELSVYDLRGRRVRSLGRRDLAAGQHQLNWDGRDEHGATVASGVYLARLVVGSGSREEVLTRSVVLQR